MCAQWAWDCPTPSPARWREHAPYLQTWLYSQGNPRIFDIYLMVLCAFVLVAAIASPETKGKDLND